MPRTLSVLNLMKPNRCANNAFLVRFQVATFLLALILSCLTCSQSHASEKRTWTDQSGKFTVEARLETADEKQVTLKKSDGQTIVIPRGRLSKGDQEFITVAEVLKVIQEQATKIEPHLPKLLSEPRSVIELIAEIQKAETRDPCAMLWCGVAFASEGGKPGVDKAQRYHDDAINRLRTIHKHMPQSHPRTLVSALNNRAILALRERKATRATALFKEIATIEPAIPHFVSHNIKVLLAVTLENKVLELGGGERRVLTELTSKASPTASPITLPKRFVYSTDFNCNQPSSQASTNRLLSLRQQQIWPELTCIVCEGTSVVDCIKCVGGTTTVYTQEQVGFNATNQTPIMAPKANRVPCPFCDGKSGFDCRNCQQGRLSLD